MATGRRGWGWGLASARPWAQPGGRHAHVADQGAWEPPCSPEGQGGAQQHAAAHHTTPACPACAISGHRHDARGMRPTVARAQHRLPVALLAPCCKARIVLRTAASAHGPHAPEPPNPTPYACCRPPEFSGKGDKGSLEDSECAWEGGSRGTCAMQHCCNQKWDSCTCGWRVRRAPLTRRTTWLVSVGQGLISWP